MLPDGFSDEADRRSTARWTPPSALPEATEADRQLVRATQAAIDAASAELDSNSDEFDDQEMDKQRKLSRSLKGRVRSFFRSVLNSGGGGGGRLNVSNSTGAEGNHRKTTGGCTRRRRRPNDLDKLENVSNTKPVSPTPPPANEAQQQKNGGNDPDNKDEAQAEDEQLPPTPPPQPEPAEEQQPPESQKLAQYPPIERPRIFRGGPTTARHKQTQQTLFNECRVIPVATLYKKVAMVPGRGRLFLSAPNNPRPLGSNMLYDIAYENRRHHSDCNRDFARAGLKKICSNYCKPSQFRYVY
ncbi:hypothetical protein BOX15_Mlig026611g2 [Macrostomum lignano]|uniref:Uncharacterized protein n=1 Tax=Macrostomum lignano TaxID=282301 RepID=A0A267DYE4_9PLAT|nr:hypothetical protein BOX15_Mlig026611g2 [Macrostomum lignano]